MKKTACWVLVVLLAFSCLLSACGEEPAAETKETKAETAAVPDSRAESTAAPTVRETKEETAPAVTEPSLPPETPEETKPAATEPSLPPETTVPVTVPAATQPPETLPPTEAPTQPAAAGPKEEDFYGTYYGENGIVLTLKEKGDAIWTDQKEDIWGSWFLMGGEIWTESYRNNYSFFGKLVNGDLVGTWNYSEPFVFSHNEPAPIVYPDPPYNRTVFSPKQIILHDGYDVTILGAELFRDDKNREAIRIYFDVVNRCRDDVVLSSILTPRMYLGEGRIAPCEGTFSPEAEAFKTRHTNLGEKVRCAAEFLCSWQSQETWLFEIRHYVWTAAQSYGAENELPPDNYLIQAEFTMDSMPALPDWWTD